MDGKYPLSPPNSPGIDHVDAKNKRRESGWLSLIGLAAALEVNTDHLRKEVLRHVPSDCKRQNGTKNEYYARGAIEAWLANRVPTQQHCEQCARKDAVIDMLLDPTNLLGAVR